MDRSVDCTIGRDMTLQWACRPGDLVMWFRLPTIFADPERELGIVDVWEMRIGDEVLITNRAADLPEWFELHPTEIAGPLVYWLMERLEAGYEPSNPIDDASIWRVRAGDRLAWVGDARPGRSAPDGILSIVQFDYCALVIGHTTRSDQVTFGSPSGEEQSPLDTERRRTALNLARKMGVPRTWAPEWKFGA